MLDVTCTDLIAERRQADATESANMRPLRVTPKRAAALLRQLMKVSVAPSTALRH